MADKMVTWDLLVAEYNRQNPLDELADAVKKTVLIKAMPEPLKTNLQVSSGVSYATVRAAITNFLKARHSWQHAPKPTSTPMDIDALCSKDKGKGKGKGKGKWGGKTEPSVTVPAFTGLCYKCGKPGHHGYECRFSCMKAWRDPDTGQLWRIVEDEAGVTERTGVCYSCGGFGHDVRECPTKHPQRSMATLDNTMVGTPVPASGASFSARGTAQSASGATPPAGKMTVDSSADVFRKMMPCSSGVKQRVLGELNTVVPGPGALREST